ncbi:MAG: hypothetical protein IKL03_02955, partial [Bacteroidaceae bacterium]|nr:hypothetical protein [Bacteroidaceae bacterium]
ITLWTRNATGVESIIQLPTSTTTNVYSITGQLMRKNVHPEQALQGLPIGLYIVNGKKVFWGSH